MKKLLISILAIVMMSISVYAKCTSGACTGKITKLYIKADGLILVGTDGNENALNCAAGAGNGGVSGVYMTLRKKDIGQNTMYSLILTAEATGKDITLKIQEGTPDCRVIYVTN